MNGGYVSLIQKGMARGADATLPIGPDNKFNMTPGYTPLQNYLSTGYNVNTLQLLLQKADLSMQSETGRLIPLDVEDGLFATPLHWVCLRSSGDYADILRKVDGTPVIEMLLRHGSPVNAKAQCPAGVTPLMLAQEEWTVRLLLDAGADPDLVAANEPAS